jgi:hypothetical protein
LTGLGFLALTGGAVLTVFLLGLGAGFCWGRFGFRARYGAWVEPSLDRHRPATREMRVIDGGRVA